LCSPERELKHQGNMEDLIKSIEIFAISKDSHNFNKNLDAVIMNLENVRFVDQEYEWENLKDKFLKVKYIHELINFYYIPENSKFEALVGHFLKLIEKDIHIYLKLKWEIPDQSIQEEIIIIKSLLRESTLEKYLPSKINKLYISYTRLVDLIEDFSKEIGFNREVTDMYFLNNFSEFKRRKLN